MDTLRRLFGRRSDCLISKVNSITTRGDLEISHGLPIAWMIDMDVVQRS